MSYGFIADEFEPRVGACDSYAHTQITFDHNSTRWRLAPSQTTEGTFPFEDVAYILSAWHPNGFPASASQNDRYTRSLADRVADVGGEVVSAVSHDSGRTWFERSLLVTGLTSRIALDLACEFGAPAYLAWTPEQLTVVPISQTIGETSARWSLTRANRYCPTIPDALPGEACRRKGGGWVGASIEAALLSTLTHWFAVDSFGCDTCHGVQATEAPGRPIGLVEVSCPSRWCKPTVLGWTAATIDVSILQTHLTGGTP